MSTFYTATQQAQKTGFTHIVAAGGTMTPLSEVLPHMKATKNTTKNGWSFATLHGVGQCLVYTRKGEMKYYRLANITNGYTTIFNSLWDMFQVSHPEIGACIAEFKNLPEAVEYARKG